MTASSTRRSRSVSSGNGISANVVMISNACQPGGERVEAQPSLGGESDGRVVDFRPSGFAPFARPLEIDVRSSETGCRTQPEIHTLGLNVRNVEALDSVGRRLSQRDTRDPFRVWFHVPRARLTVERVGRRADPQILRSAPVGRVVAGFPPGQREVGNFVVTESGSSRERVSKQELFGISVLAGRGYGPAILPARDGRRMLDRESVERDVMGLQGQRLFEICSPRTLQLVR